MYNSDSGFYKKWTIRRTNKWGYILYLGILQGIAIGLLILLTEAILLKPSFNPSQLLVKLLFFTLLGIVLAHRNFGLNEKRYYTCLAQDKKVEEGVAILEKEKRWEHENLLLILESADLLIIRNKLFWLENDQPTSLQQKNCMKILGDDLMKLKQNQIFSRFIENKRIELQLFNNLDHTHPIATDQI